MGGKISDGYRHGFINLNNCTGVSRDSVIYYGMKKRSERLAQVHGRIQEAVDFMRQRKCYGLDTEDPFWSTTIPDKNGNNLSIIMTGNKWRAEDGLGEVEARRTTTLIVSPLDPKTQSMGVVTLKERAPLVATGSSKITSSTLISENDNGITFEVTTSGRYRVDTDRVSFEGLQVSIDSTQDWISPNSSRLNEEVLRQAEIVLRRIRDATQMPQVRQKQG